MSLIARIIDAVAGEENPACRHCAKFRRVIPGVEICRHRTGLFADEFRKRPQAFGGCGVKGRFFQDLGRLGPRELLEVW